MIDFAKLTYNTYSAVCDITIPNRNLFNLNKLHKMLYLSFIKQYSNTARDEVRTNFTNRIMYEFFLFKHEAFKYI